MRSAQLLEAPYEALSPAGEPVPVGSAPVEQIPRWDLGALVDALHALAAPADPLLGDLPAAMALYAADVARAAPFYRRLACRMVAPLMDQAAGVVRAIGETAPRSVVIVGAGGGMGAAIAVHAARHGARVSLIDLPDPRGGASRALQQTAELCAAAADSKAVQVLAVAATDDAAMRLAMRRAAEFGGGRIDLVSHAAGIFGNQRAAQVTATHLALMMDVNVRSNQIALHTALPYMMASPNPSYLYVSSMAATEFVANQAQYCFTKHHQKESMKVLSHLVSHHLRVKVTELRFGHVLTRMCLGRGLDAEKMIQVGDVAELVWSIARAPAAMRYQTVEVTPTERLEGEVIWPQRELQQPA